MWSTNESCSSISKTYIYPITCSPMLKLNKLKCFNYDYDTSVPEPVGTQHTIALIGPHPALPAHMTPQLSIIDIVPLHDIDPLAVFD